MNFREPTRKRRARNRVQRPFPVPNEKNEWVTYTAHLSASGTCMVHPDEIAAVFWMGFFGKGALSRGFPEFGKWRFGAPPIIRERQWQRRKQWMQELNELGTQPLARPGTSAEGSSSNVDENGGNEEKEGVNETAKDIEEVVLDSTEDEEVCEIVEESNPALALSEDDIREICEEYMSNEKTPNSPELPKQQTPTESDELLVLPDSDSDTENYLKNVKPKIERGGFPIIETHLLTFEESFFLMYGLGCLQVLNYQGERFSIIEAWKHFNQHGNNFLNRYVVYHFFRSKGWVVREGIKCGGDFLLYKRGPTDYHSSCIVLIEAVDADTLIRDDEKTGRKITWSSIHSLNRLAQTLSKDLLIAQVAWPSSIRRTNDLVPLTLLSEFTVREVLVRRWNIQENDQPNDDEEDEDSQDYSF